MKKLKALIIGAGSIGALKPSEFDSPESKQIYTHAHACYSHPNIELVGIIDSDIDRANKAGDKWNTSAFSSIHSFYHCNYNYDLTDDDYTPDIAIVAVPTKYHIQVINDLISYRPKVIICEKPFCLNYDNAYNTAWKCYKAGIRLVINYQREYTPELKQLSNDLKNGFYGEVYNFTLRYSRGIKRDGSHALYWCLNTFGDDVLLHKNLGSKYFLQKNLEKNDFNSFLIYMTDKCGQVAFIPIGDGYSTYNADIYTEKGRVELLNNWKTIRFHSFMNSTYGDYKSTGLTFFDKETQLDQALTYMLDHVIKLIDQEVQKPDNNALQVHKLLTI